MSNSNSGVARDYGKQLKHYFRKTINFNDLNIGTLDKVKVGRVPAGAIIDSCLVIVSTAFNTTTTNTLVIGTNTGSDNNIATTGDTNLASAKAFAVTTAQTLVVSADSDIFVQSAGTGGSAGKATIIIGYVPNNDQ